MPEPLDLTNKQLKKFVVRGLRKIAKTGPKGKQIEKAADRLEEKKN